VLEKNKKVKKGRILLEVKKNEKKTNPGNEPVKI